MNLILPKPKRRTRMLVAGAASLVVAASMALTSVANAAITVSSNSTGTNNGFFYTFWQEASGGRMTIDGGNYSMSWNQGAANIVVGTGWKPGKAHTVNYKVNSWQCNGNCYMALYGWTTSPLIEYYIVDWYGSYNPSSGAQKLGTLTSDGGTYDIYRTQRVNKPSIQGNATFYQFWSVRQQKKNTGGTINVGNHFAAWEKSGLKLGSHDYQVLATEGYNSSGSSNITVSAAG